MNKVLSWFERRFDTASIEVVAKIYEWSICSNGQHYSFVTPIKHGKNTTNRKKSKTFVPNNMIFYFELSFSSFHYKYVQYNVVEWFEIYLTGKWYFYRFTRTQSVCMNECFVIIFRRLFILTRKKERKTIHKTNQTKVHRQFLLKIFFPFRRHIRLGTFSFLARERESFCASTTCRSYLIPIVY